MSELLPRPQVWSDFDGTAVELTGAINPRNWLKYPLDLMHGYPDFLRGVQDEGVEVAGIVSRRPELRRWVTNRSIKVLGLDEFFWHPDQINLVGSERKKGQFVVEKSQLAPVGMLEDKPHKIGAVLLKELIKNPEEQSVVLGVPPNIEAYESVGRLVKEAETAGAKIIRNSDGTINIAGESFRLGVVLLQHYSKDAGKDFAQRVLSS